MDRILFTFDFLFRCKKGFTPEIEELILHEKEIINEIIYERMVILQNLIEDSEDVRYIRND